jgi:hypothetical protein
MSYQMQYRSTDERSLANKAGLGAPFGGCKVCVSASDRFAVDYSEDCRRRRNLPSDPQRSFSADPVIFLPWPKPFERRARRQHIDIGVSPADNLHADRQAVR